MNIDEYPTNDRNNYAVSIGIRTEDFLKLSEIYKYTPEKCNIVCIDIANGYIQKLVQFCQKVRKLIPHCILIAGNVVTREMVEDSLLMVKLIL